MSVWIPISERNPSESGEYLVTCDFKGKRYVEIKEYFAQSNDWVGNNDEFLTRSGRKYTKVVAWMPLIKPYKD